MRLIKRLFLLAILLGLGYSAFGLYNGIPLADYQAVLKKAQQDLLDLNTESADEATVDTESPSEVEAETQPLAPRTERLKAPSNPYASLDRYVRTCPDKAEVDIPTLAAYLSEGANTNLQKARAIYIWLTDNISYDDAGYNSGNYSDTSPGDVLQNRVSVCDGFSSLFQALGEEMGIEVLKIAGYAKGYGYRPGSRLRQTDHAWNAMQVNGEWRIFDATWGQGKGKNVNGRLVSTKKFDEYWFDVDPYEAIFNHFPEDASYAFVEPAISLRDYEQMPYVRPGYLRLFQDGERIFNAVMEESLIDIPKSYDYSLYLKANNAELSGALELGRQYPFSIEAPEAEAMALVDADGNWTHFEDRLGEFELAYQATTPGTLKLVVKEPGDEKYWGVLEYQVRGQVQ